MTTVTLKPISHKGSEYIAILGPNQAELNPAIRKLPEVKWSQTNGCWYLPLNKDSYRVLQNSLKELCTVEGGLVEKYLQKKTEVGKTLPAPPDSNNDKSVQLTRRPAWQLSAVNLGELQKFVVQLKLKAYSLSTIRTYRN